MPWELIADFKRHLILSPDDFKWGGLATALVAKMIELEPRLRCRIRSLPLPGKLLNVFPGLGAQDVPKALHGHLEAPEGKTKLVRQYYCHTCGEAKAKSSGKDSSDNMVWVPQMYLSLHNGHKLSRSEPTGRVREPTWQPNRRMFFGSSHRLKGLIAVLPSAVVTTPPDKPEDLVGFDTVFLIPPADGDLVALCNTVKRASKAEEVILLEREPAKAVEQLLAWMKSNDAKALDANDVDEPVIQDLNVSESAAVRKQIEAAQAYVKQQGPKVQQKGNQ